MKFRRFLQSLIIVSSLFIFSSPYCIFAEYEEWQDYPKNPYRIKLDNSQISMSGRGGLIAADLNGDGLLDYLVSTKEGDIGGGRGTIGAYDHYGDVLWIQHDSDINLSGKAEAYGLPGWHAPGISAADVDGDRQVEIIHLNTQNEIIIRDGLTGEIKKKLKIDLPKEDFISDIRVFISNALKMPLKKALNYAREKPRNWSHFQIVNLEGESDDEIILQADPYPFRWLKAVSLTTGETIWEKDQYLGQSHGGFRAADIDGDGFDEVVGGMIIDQDGSTLNSWNYRRIKGHIDSLTIADVLPDEAGLEWIVTEESNRQDDRTALLGRRKVFFYHSFKGLEPQNVAVGEFDPKSPGLKIWCRSRFNRDQTPWVIDSKGNTITSYRLKESMPTEWSDEGVEVITAIDWEGQGRHYLAAKERHADGKICLLDPLTGEFIREWDEKAARIYVADVAGDSREEIVVVNSEESEIRIYFNENMSQSSEERERHWQQNSYRRQKMNYNYYSP